MSLKLKKVIYLAIIIVIGLVLIALLYKGKYLSAGTLIIVTWGILFVAGAYGVPFYVKTLILKYLVKRDGKAELTEIIKYCASENKYFLEVAVKKWISELESRKKIKIQDGIITKTN